MTGRRRLALALTCLALCEVLGAVVVALVARMSFSESLNGYVVSNGLMGFSFAACGGVIAWHQTRNAVGWLFLGDGLGHATGALAVPITQLVHDHGGSVAVQRIGSDVLMWSWPWSIGLFLPLALLLVPDGRPASPAWRPAAWAVGLTAPLFVAEIGLGPDPVLHGWHRGYLTWTGYHDLDALWTISELRTSASILLAVVCLVLRFRRGDELRRRQLLWLVLAAIVVIAAVVPWSFVSGTPILVLFAIPLIPIAITVGIVRAQLLDIRLVVSRALAWLLLSLLALLGYALLVGALETFVTARLGRSALVTVLVALGLAPLLPRLQRRVDRWMYGDRGDPALVASRVGEQLLTGDGSGGLSGVVGAVREALRLPYVAVLGGTEIVADAGEPSSPTATVTLTFSGEEVGALVVGLRTGERQLSAIDRSTLGVIAASMAVAVHALDLGRDLARSRERLVMAREEERRRIRQDLHDGLGPTLTGLALSADAAANLVDHDPDQVRALLAGLRKDSRTAIADVRRLVDDLRPPALDELGLVGALQQRADQLAWRSDGTALDVHIDGPKRLPRLPAAVEVAAYRIATEALTNVARHAAAGRAVVQVRCADTLNVEVVDDGRRDAAWAPGVGLTGMRERATELGGTFEAGPCESGGRVFVSLPLDAA
ncbi:MAG: sensor histidine kinase [Marmoricola sp.]